MSKLSQQDRAPVPKPVPSFWNAEPRALDDYRSTAELPLVSDVVIVGGGFAGVGTAYHLLKDNPDPPSIVLLEARKLCSGATGRNGGHVKPDTYYNVPKYTKLYGATAAAELAAFEASHVLAVKSLVEISSVSSKPDSEGMWTVQTPRGAIKTGKIVYATNGYTAQVLPEYVNTIVPVRGICSHIESPKKQDTPHLVNTYGIRFDALNNDYLIPRADGSIIVGGARQRFWHNKERWFDNTRDDEAVEEAVSYFDGYMQRHFRGWEGSDAKTKEVWTGIMGYSSDFMPHIGDVPGKPGQFIIAGFSGHGMPEILLSSKGLAAMVRDGISFEKSGLPQIFKTSKSRISSKRSLLEESMQLLWDGKAKPKL
ncbi:hypothetical protein G7Z17_g822 [Cylindrodendrum hubeiense]|uniref:FAD dependent oxidoreductase domain-containing protein n=1 Tax=Cylindrodendrum hubeiense TaxID=595255 RepID=A0A9P5HG23_9HYPO|nr:hypothetical protein G7Z17_g822 [Cylindrodendrum hubeiense]